VATVQAEVHRGACAGPSRLLQLGVELRAGIEARSVCAFGREPRTIVLISEDGSFLTARFSEPGECERISYARFLRGAGAGSDDEGDEEITRANGEGGGGAVRGAVGGGLNTLGQPASSQRPTSVTRRPSEPNGPPQQQQDRQRQAPAAPAAAAATATTTHVFSSTPTAEPQQRPAAAPPARQEQPGEAIGFLPSPPASAISDPSTGTAYKQQAFGANPNPPFSALGGGLNEDAGVGVAMDGGVGGEARGEGAGLKPPVPEQEFHDGVSDVQ
ncbi:unnamed protein product, partial [Ectocarpus sp. 12 AP-2014]